MNIASDNVDLEQTMVPRKWNIKFIRQFMIIFGITSSSMDFLTFFILLVILKSSVIEFRTTWFVESVLTELIIIFIIRTTKRFYKSRPSNKLILSTVIMIIITSILPYLPFISLLGFTPLPIPYITAIIIITIFYVILTELVKFFFYKKFHF